MGVVVRVWRLADTPCAVTAFSSFKMGAYKKTPGIHASLLRAVDQDLYLQLAEVVLFIYWISRFIFIAFTIAG
jgi:hypothetical protein